MWIVEFSDSSTMTDEGFFQVALGGSYSLWNLRSLLPVSGPVMVKRPVVLNLVEPIYTEEARRLRHEGSVVMLLEVDPTGRPKITRVLRSLGNGLDERAIEAVRNWRFRPTYEGGKPVTMCTTVEVEFHLP
jgi:TonB family protein